MSTPPDQLLLQRAREQMAADPANCVLYEALTSSRTTHLLANIRGSSPVSALADVLEVVNPIHIPNCQHFQADK